MTTTSLPARLIGSRSVSAIGLGAMPLSIEGRPDEPRAIATIHAALDAGVTLIDTADSYHLLAGEVGHNERLIRAALDSYEGDASQVLVSAQAAAIGRVHPETPFSRKLDGINTAWNNAGESAGLDALFDGVGSLADALPSLAKALDRPFLVAVISLGLSLACALLGALLAGQLGVPAGRAASVPWWAWLAGLAGFSILIARPYAAPALGAATFTGLTVTASLALSIVLDHYGLLGFEQRAANWERLLGAALMVAGMVLVSMF